MSGPTSGGDTATGRQANGLPGTIPPAAAKSICKAVWRGISVSGVGCLKASGEKSRTVHAGNPGFQREDEIDKPVTSFTFTAKQIALQRRAKRHPVGVVKRGGVGIKTPHEGLRHHPHTFGDANITRAHLAKRQIHVRKHGIEQILAQQGAGIATGGQAPHHQRDHKRQRVKPAIDGVGNPMLGEKGRFAGHFHSICVEDFGGLLLAALSPAKHISQPTGFLAFHHQFILLRYRASQDGLSCRFLANKYFRTTAMTRGLFDAFPAARRGFISLGVGLLAIGMTACESRISAHGHAVDSTELDQIIPGETRLADLEAVLGRPSFEGAFDSGKIYYISEVMVEPPAGRKRTSARTLIVISLDDTKTVSAIEVRDETSGKTIAYLDERSPTPGDTFGVTEQMFSTLRRKPR